MKTAKEQAYERFPYLSDNLIHSLADFAEEYNADCITKSVFDLIFGKEPDKKIKEAFDKIVAEKINQSSSEPLPFDLQKALAGEPVITRDGSLISEITQLKTINQDHNVFAIINGMGYWYNYKGAIGYANDVDHELDLFMAPRFVTKWVNVYQDKGNNEMYVQNEILQATKELMEGEAGTYTIATVPITIPVK